MHGIVNEFHYVFSRYFLCADTARPLIVYTTHDRLLYRFCYPSDAKCIALPLGKYTSSDVRQELVVGALLSYPRARHRDMFCCVSSATDVGFGAAGVEEAAGGRLPNSYWGNGQPGGEEDLRNRRDVRLPIEAHAALRHAL